MFTIVPELSMTPFVQKLLSMVPWLSMSLDFSMQPEFLTMPELLLSLLPVFSKYR